MSIQEATAGYTYGQVSASPVTMQDLAELKESVLWSDADQAALKQAGAILIPQIPAILDVWYGFVGSHSHLVATFAGADGAPSPEYLPPCDSVSPGGSKTSATAPTTSSGSRIKKKSDDATTLRAKMRPTASVQHRHTFRCGI